MRNMIRRSSEQRRASQEIQTSGTYISLDGKRSSLTPLTFDQRVPPLSSISLFNRRHSAADQRRNSLSPSALDGRRWSLSPGLSAEKRGPMSPNCSSIGTFSGFCFPSRHNSKDVNVTKEYTGKKLTSSTVTFCIILMSAIVFVVLVVSYYKFAKLLQFD